MHTIFTQLLKELSGRYKEEVTVHPYAMLICNLNIINFIFQNKMLYRMEFRFFSEELWENQHFSILYEGGYIAWLV